MDHPMPSAGRTITLPTLDFGDVTLSCPVWCAGHDTEPQHRIDLFHQSTERILTLPTRKGPVELLLLAYEERPFTETWPGTTPFVNVGFSGDFHPSDAHQLHAMADALMDQAAILRQYATDLAQLLAGGAL